MRTRALILLPCLVLGSSTVFAQGHYHEKGRIAVPGNEGWDYLLADSTNHRLYLSHGSHVVVISTQTKKVVGDIPNTQGVHGIAVAPALNRGFTSNGRANTVTIFNLKTLATIGTVKVGTNPDAIIYDPATKRVFTFNGRSSDATAVDAATGKVVGTIALGGRPEFAVADGKGMLYDNIEDKSEVVAINARSLKVTKRWSIAPGEGPSGLAMDTASRRLFSVCDGKMMVSDADAGRVIATVAIGDGPDAAGFDPALKLAFSSNGQGTLTVVHEDSPNHFTVLENANTQPGARTMALDAKTHTVYLVTAKTQPGGGRRQMVPGTFTVLIFGR